MFHAAFRPRAPLAISASAASVECDTSADTLLHVAAALDRLLADGHDPGGLSDEFAELIIAAIDRRPCEAIVDRRGLYQELLALSAIELVGIHNHLLVADTWPTR